MSRTRSSGTSASSMTIREPPLAWSIASTMPTPNLAKRSPVFHDYGVDCGVCQQFHQLGAFVVEATGDFGDDVIEQHSVLSGVSPYSVGLILQVVFLFCAAHPGVSDDAAVCGAWVG